ncbi:putative aminoacrylate peracid reductase RutC [Salipiger pallidus]|uniref:Putative aminoacrylate peracid reductase RutC n=1 Tax=Salipiger pallidus TaxID=1775170 RepID=A0A8J2ZHT6_9RHOB|nr:Rid family hydrolase [Salipiger pallidus]GGG65612.1 putative aminoacrylate peracid reductase RutC [Salipiger pallidus]
MFTPVIPEGAPKPIAPFVPGSRVGDTLYVAGMLALGPDGESLHTGDVKAQTRYVIDEILRVVKSEGGSAEDICYNAIFLKNREDYAAFNEVYAEYFGANPPARYCIISELVRDELLVEIASTAYLGKP